jgi:hypothetical protein
MLTLTLMLMLHYEYSSLHESDRTRRGCLDFQLSFLSSQSLLHDQHGPQHLHHGISVLEDEQNRTSDRERRHPFLGCQHQCLYDLRYCMLLQ